MGITILAISDTHSLHHKIRAMPDADVLIHSGDFTGSGTERDLIKFNQWLGTLPYKHKLVVPGNHDTYCEDHPGIAKQLLSNCTLLIDEEVVIDGFRFYGMPWTPEFGRWSFMLPRGAGMRSVLSKVPEGIDVLISHGPPMGILDNVLINPYDPSQGVNHVGCADTYDTVMRIQPKVHIFGHLHDGYGQLKMGSTLFVNAAICDESYRPDRAPVLIRLD